jgi:hypothetical protein
MCVYVLVSFDRCERIPKNRRFPKREEDFLRVRNISIERRKFPKVEERKIYIGR